MRKILITIFTVLFTVLFLSSCAPTAGVSNSKYGPDDPSNKILVEEDLEKRDMVDGYRVKVASTDSEPEAQQLEKQIVEAVHEPVYIEFIVDKYMIYAGDCQNKEEADILKEKLKEAGFSKVYSVPKKVYKNNFEIDLPEDNVPVTDTSGEDMTPAVAPMDNFEKIIGYRVQLIAAENKKNAEKVKDIISKEIDERVYIVLAEDNLFKVQIGDYLSKMDAEKMRDRLRTEPNWKDAFIQKSYIFLDMSEMGDGDFYVQVGAFSSQTLAENFINSSLISLGYNNASVFSDKGLYKVLVGSFASKTEAQAAREKLTSEGFEGAWIMRK